MKIVRIRLENINGFSDTGFFNVSPNINVLVGPNNSGKSTILASILKLQHPHIANVRTKIASKTSAIITLIQNGHYKVHDSLSCNAFQIGGAHDLSVVNYEDDRKTTTRSTKIQPFSSEEPHNIIYPYLSKRKVTEYNEAINISTTHTVTGNLSNLYPKIAKLCDIYQPGHQIYVETTKEIFAYPISTIDTENGKRAAYVIDRTKHIPITSMGEGVTNILGLIVDISAAEDKIFLIEELENDIHPKALKALLSLIKDKSRTNQFFISTHSNIVLKELGADIKTKIFKVSMSINSNSGIPDSVIKEVGTEKSERIAVLEDLGYEFQDFDLWHAWLFLEESSTERLIREYFIKWYVPSLTGKLRTIASNGVGKLQKRFDAMNDQFAFIHLEPVYKNKAWVLVDSGDEEKTIIDKLKEYYLKHDWHENKFRQFTEHDFEKYYPTTFKTEEEINTILTIEEKQAKRVAKKGLLEELITWINADEGRAKTAFQKSAKEVIDILKEIEKELTPTP